MVEGHGRTFRGSLILDSVDSRVADLRNHISASAEAFERAAMISTLNDDPVKEQLLALGLGMKALLSVCEAGAAVQLDISASLDQKAEIVAEQALAYVKDSTEEIVNQAVPRVLELVARAGAAKIALAKRKVLLIGAGVFLAGLGVFGGYAYSVGFSNGHMRGIQTALTIDANAAAAGPQAADDWAMLILRNNPIQELAACEKDITTSPGGQACLMPVWIGPTMPPPPAGT